MNTSKTELNPDEMNNVAAGRYLVPTGETVLPKTLVTTLRDGMKAMFKICFFGFGNDAIL